MADPTDLRAELRLLRKTWEEGEDTSRLSVGPYHLRLSRPEPGLSWRLSCCALLLFEVDLGHTEREAAQHRALQTCLYHARLHILLLEMHATLLAEPVP